jgi:hypothetical protein
VRFKPWPRYSQSRPEHRITTVSCGYCHAPAIPFGSLAICDTHLAIEDDSFVLVGDPDQPDFNGSALKFLRRNVDGRRELVSQVGAKPLSKRDCVIGTLVAVYMPRDGDAAGIAIELDTEIRAALDQALASERARRGAITAAAVARWGQPNTAATR